MPPSTSFKANFDVTPVRRDPVDQGSIRQAAGGRSESRSRLRVSDHEQGRRIGLINQESCSPAKKRMRRTSSRG
jgi:hypothetical protein